MAKRSTLIICLLTAIYSGIAQVPLKVWDQVVGTTDAEGILGDLNPGGIKLVKTNYGMALVYSSEASGRSGNINTDDNPGNKPTGVVVGLNANGTKRFDKRFLAQNCAPDNCYVEHYTLFNSERFFDAVSKGENSGNILVSGIMNSGTDGGVTFVTHYEINSNGQTVFGKRLLEPYINNAGLRIKYSPLTFSGMTNGQDPVPTFYNNQTFLFTTTRAGGGVGSYIHDQGRTVPFNVSCFNVGNSTNIGFIRRNTAYEWDETGLSNTNRANLMGGESGEYVHKVLSSDDKYFQGPVGADFIVAATTSSTNTCFFNSPAKGGADIIILGVDKAFNKVSEFRIGGPSSSIYTHFLDLVSSHDGNLLVSTMTLEATGQTSTVRSMNLAKYTLAGVKLWETPDMFVGVPSNRLIATEDGGCLMFTGINWQGNSYDNRGNGDVHVVKFSTDGQVQWSCRFGSELGERDDLTVVELDNDEYAFAIRSDNTGGNPISGDRSLPAIGGADDIWVMKFKNYPRHSISITGLDKPEYVIAQDNTILIDYSLPANFNHANRFYAQISDAAGDFSGSVNAGLYVSQTGGSISLQIPEGVVPGDNYRVRIISTEPRDTSLASASFRIVQSPLIASDSLALVNLYNSTNGANWTNKTNWKTLSPLETWHGVSVNAAGRVVAIDLMNNNLQGSIPDELGSLSALEYLYMAANQLSGLIPTALGNLLSLKTLDLSYNPNISGSIPSSLGNLSNLEFLWLGENNSQLSGTLPSSLGNLTNIRRLIIGGTQISGSIPIQLGNLGNLEYLRLSSNQLTGDIPASLGNLSSLEELDLSSNQLTGTIPQLIGNLSNARSIRLPGNKLSGVLPHTLTSLTNLNIQGLDISSNYFNFDGLSALVPLLSNGRMRFLPQHPLVINKTGCSLAVTAGGNLANNTYRWLQHNQMDIEITGDSVRPNHKPGMYLVQVQNSAVPGITLSSNWLDASAVVAAQPQELVATHEQTDAEGWTHYDYRYTNAEGLLDYVRLLSLKKNGNNIGTIGDGSFQVRLAATTGAGSGEGLLLNNPLITNTSGTYVMHRYWSVIPTQQPGSTVGVRFYFNEADIDDVKGSVPWLVDASGLFFYKSIGGDPNPETNLNGATGIIGIYEGTTPGTDRYIYENLGCGIHRVEYLVSGFSGGGGGGTINGLALPIKLSDFSGVYINLQTELAWTSAQEQNTSHFIVERSVDGALFTAIGQVKAAGNSNQPKSYNFKDAAATSTGASLVYYRLLMVDLDGRSEYSKVIAIKLPDNKQAVRIGPNPAKNKLSVYLPPSLLNKNATISIYDLHGKKVREDARRVLSAQKDIDITSLTNGMYILIVQSDEGQSTHRFIKK